MVFVSLTITNIFQRLSVLDVMTVGEMAQHYRTDIHFFGLLIGENDSVWDVHIPGYNDPSDPNGTLPHPEHLTFRLILHSGLLNADMTFRGQDDLAAVSDWLVAGRRQIYSHLAQLIADGQLVSATQKLADRRKTIAAAAERELEQWTEL